VPGLTVADAYLRLRVDGAQLRREVSRDVQAGGAPAGAAFGKAFKVAAVAALAGIGAAIGIGAIAVEQASKFQQAMTQIRTQAGGTAKDVAVLSAQVLKLGGTYAEQGPRQLAAALYHLKSVGLDNVQAMKALRVTSDLAAVGQADLESTANALAGAWRVGIRGATSFSQAAGTVNAIIGAGNMHLQDFVSAIGTGILPAAKTWGLSLGQVGAALALMTDEGQNAAEAATRLRMTFALLGAPSAAAAKQLAIIGITGLQLGNAMRSPGGLIAAITLLKTHLDASGLSASESAALLAHAFGGGRSSATILGLINNLEVLRKKQDQINRTTGRYTSAVIAQRQTAGAQFARLGAIVDTFGIRLGLALLPPVTAFVGFLVNTAVPAAVGFAHTVGVAFHQIIPVDAIKRDWRSLLLFLGLARPPPAKLSTADLLHMPAPAKLSVADLLHPLAPVTVPMTVDLLHRAGGSGRTGGLTNTIANAVQGINWTRITGLLGAPLGDALGKAFGWITQHAATLTSQLVTALAGLDWVNIGKQVGGHTLGFAIGLVSSFGAELFSPSFWQHHWWDVIVAALSVTGIGRIGGALAKVLEHIPVLRLFAPLLRGLATVTGPVNKGIDKIVSAVWRGLWDGFRTVFPRAAAFLEREFHLITDRIVGAAGVVRYDALMLGRGLLQGIEHGTSNLVQLIASLIGKLVNPFRPAGGWLVSHGGDLVAGLLRGIARAAAGVGPWINAHLVQPIIHAVMNYFGIHSPSRVMAGLGSNIMTGLFQGIMSHNPLAVVRKVFGSMPAALGHLVERGLVSVASLPGRALRALTGLGGSLLGKIGGFLGSLFGGGGGVQQWAPMVLQVLKMLGQPAGALGIVLSQIATESGGNPRAINLTDINAQMGVPSKGLLQVIRPTFNAYAGPFRSLGQFNPFASIYAGLNYAIHRYGTTGWMNVLGHGHGYLHGGWVTEPVRGIGLRSGHAYSFAEDGRAEYVSPAGAVGGGGGVDALLAKLDRVIKAVEKNAAQTGAALAQALDRGGRRAAYAGIYGG